MLATLRKCLAFLPLRARWRWAWLVPLAVTSALLEAIGAITVFVLIKIINNPSQVASLPVISTIYAVLPWHEERQVVFSFTILVALFYILKNSLLAVAAYMQSTVASDSVAALARRMLTGYLRLGAAATNQVYADFISFDHPLFVPFSESNGEGLRFADRLVLDQVSYTYDGTPAPVLQDVALTIRRGESVGIVGPTGVGKSALIDLILGLLQPSSGRITIDGRDIFQALRSWQRKIGYVPQSIFLVDDSMRRNIAFGLKDADIDEPRLQAAVRMAQLEEFVASLPPGLDTIVGDRLRSGFLQIRMNLLPETCLVQRKQDMYTICCSR